MFSYPLQWPNGKLFRKESERRKSRFFSVKNVNDASSRLLISLKRFQAKNIVITCNCKLNYNGKFNIKEIPSNPAVAVYFTLNGKQHCLPCDTYQTVEANMAAIAAHIEAVRSQERYGVASVAEMFTGFISLPPTGMKSTWFEILGVQPNSSEEEINSAYRNLTKKRHPDMPGGSHELMSELNIAREEGLKHISN